MEDETKKSQLSEQDHSDKRSNGSRNPSATSLIPQALVNDQRLATALSYQNALLHQLQQPNCKQELWL